MLRLLRVSLAALLLAAPALFSVTPLPAHAFCVFCDDVRVNEYVNEVSGHHLLLPAGDPEVAIVEGGGAGPGWVRTGNDFGASFRGNPVCRFYSPVFNTHFYTADAAECELVKQNPDWIYEKSPFNAFPPVAPGACIGVTVYRLRLAGDHRYTADTALREAMIAKGWSDEGIAWCADFGGREAVSRIQPFPQRIDSVQGCQSGAGDCVALDSLAPMPIKVPPFLPPNFITRNPDYPAGLMDVIGSGEQFDLFTGQSVASDVLKHSFAGLDGALFINGHDRTGGDYARITPMTELPGVAGSNADQRLFVWRGTSDHELRVSVFANVGLVAQDGPGSHAYGGPVMEFGDATTGHSFLVSLQAYGTVPPGDFVAPDARNGEPIVSTVFRPNPMFGTVLSGGFIPCHGDGSRCAPEPQLSQAPVPFAFSLKRADFQAALAHARTVDPALSGNVADYFLARVAFNNETYLDARLGATIVGLLAQVWFVE
jgi:hypothetical protein